MKLFFCKKILLFSLVLLVVSYIISSVTDNNLKKSNLNEFAIWNDILNSKCNADILITGSSTASFHISPKILDSILKLNSYNIGMIGLRFDLQLARYNLYRIYNKKPKIILQILSLNNLEFRDSLYNSTQFLPYLNYSIIKTATKGFKNSFNLFDYYLPLYKYIHHKHLIKESLKNIIKHNNIERKDYKGYYTYPNTWDSIFYQKLIEHVKKKGAINVKIDTNLLQQFKSFVENCNKDGMQLILVYTPDYKPAQKFYANRDMIINTYKSVAQKNNIPFLDYSSDSMANNIKYFYDARHLSKYGSEVFSEKLANDIKQLINKN
jgi:hypothetical protein